MGENFMVNGLAVDDEIASQESLTFPVTFSPEHTGNFDDTLTVVFGPPEAEEGVTIPCYVQVSDTCAGVVFSEIESFTADRNYPLKINAFTDQPGELYVLLTHIPFSGGTIYAVTPDGNIVPFPYQSPSDWQNLYYATGTPFNFNLGLLELQQLKINSLGGSWRVTSSY